MHTCLSRGSVAEEEEEQGAAARQINCLVRSWPGCVACWPGLANARASSNFAHRVRLMTALALAMINDDAAAAARGAAAAAVAAATTRLQRPLHQCLFIYLPLAVNNLCKKLRPESAARASVWALGK